MHTCLHYRHLSSHKSAHVSPVKPTLLSWFGSNKLHQTCTKARGRFCYIWSQIQTGQRRTLIYSWYLNNRMIIGYFKFRVTLHIDCIIVDRTYIPVPKVPATHSWNPHLQPLFLDDRGWLPRSNTMVIIMVFHGMKYQVLFCLYAITSLNIITVWWWMYTRVYDSQTRWQASTPPQKSWAWSNICSRRRCTTYKRYISSSMNLREGALEHPRCVKGKLLMRSAFVLVDEQRFRFVDGIQDRK